MMLEESGEGGGSRLMGFWGVVGGEMGHTGSN